MLNGTTGGEIQVQVMGAPLNPMISPMLVSAEVDQSMFVPSQFKLVFRGKREHVLLPGGFQLGTKINLQVTDGGAPTPLMTMADVTSIDVDFGPDGDLTIIRGMDASHRLMHGTKAMVYPGMTASAVVMMLLAEATIPFTPATVPPTSNVYEWLTQSNISSWVFIQQLASIENCVAYVDELGMFHFGAMKNPVQGLPPVMSYLMPSTGAQLVLGKNLIRMRGSVGGSEQVPVVTALGKDPKVGRPVLGPFPTVPSTSVSLDPAALPPVIAVAMGAKPFFETSRPYDNEGVALTRAQAVAADIAGAMAELEAECLGNPAVSAGSIVSIGMCGPPFDGMYVVSAARHSFEVEHSGYSTWLTVGGRRDRSLFALASGAGSAADATRPNVSGVVTGKVVNNVDPLNVGRVQVMFEWLGASYVSPFAPTVQMGASPIGGSLWLPEVGDEVLVAFDRGDMDHPYVIGNLYGGLSRPVPPATFSPTVASRRITSRTMQQITFDDGPAALGITIATGPAPTTSIKLDAQQQGITMMCPGRLSITAAAGIEIDTPASFSVKAGKFSVEAGSFSVTAPTGVTLTSTGNVSVTGTAGVKVSSGTSVSVSAPMVALG